MFSFLFRAQFSRTASECFSRSLSYFPFQYSPLALSSSTPDAPPPASTVNDSRRLLASSRSDLQRRRLSVMSCSMRLSETMVSSFALHSAPRWSTTRSRKEILPRSFSPGLSSLCELPQ